MVKTTTNQGVKLQKAIAIATNLSRRQAEELIKQKQVKVNGRLASVGERVNLAKDKIEVKGKKIVFSPTRSTYLVIYKPRQVITSKKDDLGRKTIMDLVPKEYKHLFPVGRLDYESEGLMLLTNDGDLAYKLTHPKFQMVKVYQVKPDRRLTQAAFLHLKKGKKFGQHLVKPVSLKRLPDGWLEISLTSGKKHVVRKLLKHAGYETERLKRVQFGPFRLGDLQPGEFREVDARAVLA